MRGAFALLLLPTLLAMAPGQAQERASGGALPSVTISGKALRDPVEKSYRRMVRGMDLFERNRGMAPQAQLRFKLLPRKPGTDLNNLDLHVLGTSVEIPVAVAADQTFTLPRDAKALAENAVVSPDRKALTMTWRADIRTPGLPPNTRRLGDLRLECLVGMEAGLISNSPSFLTQLFGAASNTPAYCNTKENRYLFFADRPVFGVTLAWGSRREAVRIDRLYASAIDDRNLRNELPYCDCEVLLDRTYFLPLDDLSWPNDTLVEFDFMEAAGAPR